MALDKKNLVALAKFVANGDNSASPLTYSVNGENQSINYNAANEALRREFQELAGSWSDYRENKNLIFSIIEETIDDVLPKKVEQRYMDFAEVKQFAQGDKIAFRRKIGNNNRAKQFITRVGLAANYEVFKLSKKTEIFEIRTSAIGGAAQIGFEEFLDGRVDFAEVVRIVMEGMDELIYKEVGHALTASLNQLPAANKVATAGFDEDAMDKLVMIASAYGNPTIYCTKEFAVKMIPQDAWRYTEDMKKELWNTGKLANYKGTPVVILEQGFEDETNVAKVIDPGYVWIIPGGADTKPVKIALEGGAIVNEYDNRGDLSKEIQIYKKVGVACMLTNDICSYVDTDLLGKMTTWSLTGIHSVRDYAGNTH